MLSLEQVLNQEEAGPNAYFDEEEEDAKLRRDTTRARLNPSPVVPNPVDPDSVAFGLGIVVSDSVPMDMEKSEESEPRITGGKHPRPSASSDISIDPNGGLRRDAFEMFLRESEDAQDAELWGVEPLDSEASDADDENTEESQPLDEEPAEPPRKRFCSGLYVEVPADRLPDPASPNGRFEDRDCSGEDTKEASSEDPPSSPGFCPRDCMLLCCIDRRPAKVRRAYCDRIRKEQEERELYLDNVQEEKRPDTDSDDFV